MKNIKLSFICLTIIVQTAFGQSYDFSKIDQILQDSVNVLGGGLSFSVIKNDSVFFRQGYGSYFSNPDTIIPIASATKWISASVIMDLINDNLLTTNDTIGTYLPVMTTNGKGDRTIAECFSHSAGMDLSTPYLRDTALTLEKCVDSIAQEPYAILARPPGTKFAYGGLSMQTVGRIAEVVTNQPWDSVFLQRIAYPLQMTNTHYNTYGETDNPHIGGGINSNLADIEKFMKYLLNYGRYNNQTVTDSIFVAEMENDYVGSKPIIYSPYSNLSYIDTDLSNPGYGFGVWRIKTSLDSLHEFVSQGALGFTFWVNRSCGGYAAVLSVRDDYVNVLPTFLKIKQELKYIFCNSITSVEENDDSGFLIFPNPASEYIEVNPPFVPPLPKGDAEGRGISDIKIYNTFGECLVNYELPMTNYDNTRIDISHLPIGLYFIKFGNYSEKFMVVR